MAYCMAYMWFLLNGFLVDSDMNSGFFVSLVR